VPRAGRAGRVHADELVQEGLFAQCRNPLYVGNFLVLLGLFAILNSWAGWVLGVPATLFTYLAIVAAEEKFLAGRFGAEYDDYCRRVPRFGLTPMAVGRALKGARFDGLRVLRKEYGQVLIWLGADWNDEQHGWAIISKHDFMARLTKDGRSVDFYVDLMGDLTVEVKAVNPGQDMGRLLAGLILLASVLVAVIIAKHAGYL
jgi:hypothetical protein